MFEGQYFSPFNCIIQKYKRESLLYFAPERWEKTNPTTYKTDSFSVGICLILLDNYLVFSEEQLAEKFTSFSKPYADFCADNNIHVNKKTNIYKIANDMLSFSPNQRKTPMDLIYKLSEMYYFFTQNYDYIPHGNIFPQCLSLHLKESK